MAIPVEPKSPQGVGLAKSVGSQSLEAQLRAGQLTSGIQAILLGGS
jgi:hypothetical protein